jgi:hypothetical protein
MLTLLLLSIATSRLQFEGYESCFYLHSLLSYCGMSLMTLVTMEEYSLLARRATTEKNELGERINREDKNETKVKA